MKLNDFVYPFLVAALFFGSCSQERNNGDQQAGGMKMEGGDHSAHAEMELGAGEPTEESIYHVDSVWNDRDSRQMKLADLRGEVQVVAMVYTHCEYACPRILADMKRIRVALSGEAQSSTNFLIISIDPERDTPERLTRFADENNLDEENWTLLNGNDGDILEVAALLGVKYKRISDTDFTHSNMISVLNREGEIVHQRKQLSDNQSEIIRAIEQRMNS